MVEVKTMSKELTVFRRFVKHHPAMLSLDSAIDVKPRKPDVECYSATGEIIAFELGEVLDERLASNTMAVVKLPSALHEFCSTLPPTERTRLEHAYGRSNIHIWFKNDVTLNRRRRSFPAILTYLLEDGQFTGEHIPRKAELPKVIRKLL